MSTDPATLVAGIFCVSWLTATGVLSIINTVHERRKNMTIADRISELRKSREMSQEELAEMAGVSRQAVSKWESEQSVPDMYNVVALSEIFGVTTDYLLKGVEDPGERPERRNKPSLTYNIIATTLNVLGLLVAFGFVGIEQEYQAGTLVGFVFMVLGVMTFMLGTTRISRREQLPNACRFFRLNVWMIAFFVFSMIYNASIGNAVVPVPMGTTLTYVGDKVYVNGRIADTDFFYFTRDVAPAIFVIIYSLFCAATTYVLTVIERKATTFRSGSKEQEKKEDKSE